MEDHPNVDQRPTNYLYSISLRFIVNLFYIAI
jgi:hypothetical protein